MAQCATPTFNPGSSGVRIRALQITVSINTTTTGAYLRYTTDGSTPTSSHGTLIQATSGNVTLQYGHGCMMLKAIAYKAGLVSSAIKLTPTASMRVKHD